MTEAVAGQSMEPPVPSEEKSTPEGDKKVFEIDIFRAWCKACGICAAFCPRQCLSLDDEGAPQIVNAERCTGCGWCELHCPDFAISVRGKKPVNPQESD